MKIRALGGTFNVVHLSSFVTGLMMSHVLGGEPLKDSGTEWEYLFYKENGDVVDPGESDFDFHNTWFEEEGENFYDGPAFVTGRAPFGYGEMRWGNYPDELNKFPDFPETNIWNLVDPADDNAENIPPFEPDAEPPKTRLHTAYFRTVVTPTEPVNHLRFRGTVDDGLVIYVNGFETIGRVRMGDEQDAWDLPADDPESSAHETEAIVYTTELLNLPADEPITIAISLHNAEGTGGNSSDLWMDLDIESVDSNIPGNDDFENAKSLVSILSGSENTFCVSTDISNGEFELGATRESGEPVHNGDASAIGSVWYRYDAVRNQRIWVSLNGSINGPGGSDAEFDPQLAVYTGDFVDQLTLVNRYKSLPGFPATSSADEEVFAVGARVEFDVEDGVTYYIAVAGSPDSFGTVKLTHGPALVPLDPLSELVPPGSEWDYLLYANSSFFPADPATVDPDFYQSGPGWTTASGYNGPAFKSGNAPLGYGDLKASPLVTDIWEGRDHDDDGQPNDTPPDEMRYSAYFRTTFTPTKEINSLAFYGTVDDGAVIYINGDPRGRINIEDGGDRDDWQLLAERPDPLSMETEAQPQGAIVSGLTLPANQPVEVAVSLHNLSNTSSDLGLNLQIFEQVSAGEPPVTGDRPEMIIMPSGTPGTFDLTWNWDPGVAFDLEASTTLEAGSWELVEGASIVENNGSYSVSVTPPQGTLRIFYQAIEQ